MSESPYVSKQCMEAVVEHVLGKVVVLIAPGRPGLQPPRPADHGRCGGPRGGRTRNFPAEFLRRPAVSGARPAPCSGIGKSLLLCRLHRPSLGLYPQDGIFAERIGRKQRRNGNRGTTSEEVPDGAVCRCWPAVNERLAVPAAQPIPRRTAKRRTVGSVWPETAPPTAAELRAGDTASRSVSERSTAHAPPFASSMTEAEVSRTRVAETAPRHPRGREALGVSTHRVRTPKAPG